MSLDVVVDSCVMVEGIESVRDESESERQTQRERASHGTKQITLITLQSWFNFMMKTRMQDKRFLLATSLCVCVRLYHSNLS